MNLIEELEAFIKHGTLENQKELLKKMAEHIGSTDPYLRDKLIYTSYYHLIFDGHLERQQLRELMATMLEDDFFHFKLGERETDSVFQRSFSALVIALLIEYDCTHHLFDKAVIEVAANQAIHYIKYEKDYRGYVLEKGWAHAIAHGADVLDAIAKHPFFTDVELLLSAIEVPLLSGHAFTDDEEERLANAVYSLLTHKQAEEKIVKWIAGLTEQTDQLLHEQRGSIDSYRVQYTMKNFLKALYFLLKFKDRSQALRNAISEQLLKWSHF